MQSAQSEVNLGFTDEIFPEGTHICQVYADDEEREEAILKYILSGVKGQERTACFTDKTGQEKVSTFFAEHNCCCSSAQEHGNLLMSGAQDVYFEGDEFNPDRMLKLLTEFYESSKADGKRARVIGEMDPKIHTVAGGNRLFEYEARVSQLLRTHPVTSVCQYNASEFDGKTIMDVLKVHPLMIVRGTVVRNPFFVEPEEFLASI
ncbi:MEDS domain-containing protein [Magnetovibrio sp. PR-2]|uniref:MEDS domain-containing protein n=1 Tax=Magnetovibrio sp. PR-2 TaxID=3120356 RepID=UPI002FCE3ACA